MSTALSDPYRVKRGDTVSKIAKRSGKSIAEIGRLNKLNKAMFIKAGQTLYLSEATAFGVTAQFLDALRAPIKNLNYQLCYDGQTVYGTTGEDGLVPRQITRSAQSTVEILVQDFTGAWKQVAAATSDYGHKLLTLVSGYVVTSGNTELHPEKAPVQPTRPFKPPATRQATPQVERPKASEGAPTKNNPSVKTQPQTGPQGQKIIQIGVEIPKPLLEMFSTYTGELISESDWVKTANLLECEVEVLQAISDAESGKRPPYWRLNNGQGAVIPYLLFERHLFSNLTKRKFDKTHPDISWPAGYLIVSDKNRDQVIGKEQLRMPTAVVQASDIYTYEAGAYLRMLKAYKLLLDHHMDPAPALQACSWGKFQILGDNFRICRQDSAEDFVGAICQSELLQLPLLEQFIRNKRSPFIDPKNKSIGRVMRLSEAVKVKDWNAIAHNYNGPNYANNKYHEKLIAHYKKRVSQKT